MSIMFNEICINEEMLPKYTYIYIYIFRHVMETLIFHCMNGFHPALTFTMEEEKDKEKSWYFK